MLLKVYSIYDSKVESYSSPFYAIAKGEAIRSFAEVANDDKTKFGKYPEDFTLFELGTYNDSNAEFVLYTTPASIGKAIEFIKS